MTLPRPAALEPARGADAYAQLHRLIMRGALAPGARVSEADLATRVGVSRTPAREAIRQLLAEGLLVRDGGGARPRVAVASLSAADVEELYAAAAALEGVAARAVADLTPAQRRDLVAALRACESRFRAGARERPLDFDVLFERHNAFHETLRDACAGPAIRALLVALQPRLDRYEWFYAPLIGPDFSATYREHAAIIAAVRVGNAAACERAVRANWFGGGTRLAQALKAAGEIGSAVLVRRAGLAR